MSNCISLPILSTSSGLPVHNLDLYIQQVNKVPILEREEELALAKRMHELNDRDAAQLLILAHLRYVVKVARGYMGYGLSLADLVQEGTIGLMKAVKRFDYKQGVRLVTFAIHWIKAEINEFVIKNWRIVKIATTKAQRKLFFKLRSSKKTLNWLTDKEAQKIAADLGVKPCEVLQMEQRLSAKDAAFDAPTDEQANNGEEKAKLIFPVAYLEAENSNPELMLEQAGWEKLLHERLHVSLAKLDARSQEIIKKRWLAPENKLTLAELADIFKISKERVRQLEQQALRVLKEAIAV